MCTKMYMSTLMFCVDIAAFYCPTLHHCLLCNDLLGGGSSLGTSPQCVLSGALV